MARLWEVAVDEANNAKDSQRRIDEISGLPERGVVDVYIHLLPRNAGMGRKPRNGRHVRGWHQ